MIRFRSPLRSPLFWRVLVWFCVVNLLVLFVGGVLTRRFIEYSSAQDIDWPAIAQQATQAYEAGGKEGFGAWARQERRVGVDATLYENGQPLRDMRMPQSLRQQLPGLLEDGRDVELEPWPGYYFAVQQVTGSDGTVREMVAISNSLARVPPRMRQQILLGVQLALSLLFIAIAGWWVARSVARPVEALRDATRRMAKGEFSTRVDAPWKNKHDELGELSRDFNGMAERIEMLIAHERGVLQDLSHELRSPLARLHLIMDLAQHSQSRQDADGHFAHAEREIVRLDRMTGEMLALSRLEAGLPGMEREAVPLDELLVERLEAAAIDARARQVNLRLLASGHACVLGSRLLLERALDNLVSNAIKFSPEHGDIDVAITLEAGHAQLCLRDHGPGVPVDELDLMFRPFYRGSNASRAEGHGLGLSIVQRVVQAHGGRIEAANAEGGGLAITLYLPLAS
ncbi:HAMP domain-containing sensor histidine kinase [Dyella sp.]|uniref:HAMP domain-containing sensor histidine kinase n=1 Tax=Dyella sp. TaxID=1869338 RepID=UPI002ED25A67